jgi:hypothetical protein
VIDRPKSSQDASPEEPTAEPIVFIVDDDLSVRR